MLKRVMTGDASFSSKYLYTPLGGVTHGLEAPAYRVRQTVGRGCWTQSGPRQGITFAPGIEMPILTLQSARNAPDKNSRPRRDPRSKGGAWMEKRRDTVAEAAETRRQQSGARDTIPVNATRVPSSGSGDGEGGDDES